jgi:RNA polymerase sigma factor (sigma-70 family)
VTPEQQKQLKEAARALQKDPEGAFNAFYELSKEKVFYLILSYVHDYPASEDLLQDTYIQYLDSLDKLSFHLNPIAYLLSIAKNKAIDYLRKQHPQVDLDEPGMDEVIGEEEVPIDDSAPLLLEIKVLLSPFEFQVYTLHVLSDLTFKEISKIAHRPIGTLTYTYSEAIDKLQKGLSKQWTPSSKNN